MADKENKCKYLYSEPYYTPNNYDLTFSPSEIPVNIPQETIPNLANRLQKLMPLSKYIHIKLDGVATDKDISQVNSFKLTTHLKINGFEVVFK